MVNLAGIFAVASSLLSTTLAAYPPPRECSGVCVNTHDPSIVRRESDGRYFRFSTGGDIAVHSAPDISGPWKYDGAAIPGGSKAILENGNRNDMWAPDVSLVGDTYYMYYANVATKPQNAIIGYATSPSLDVGSWTDYGSSGVESRPGARYNAIDANLIYANDQFYMTFGSYWEDIFQVPMKNPPTEPAGEPHQVAFDSRNIVVEGPFLFGFGDYYYLFFSLGKCCGYDQNRPGPGEEYRIMVCRSSDPTSGFIDANGKDCRQGGGTVVYESHDNIYGPGGQGVTMDPNHGPVLYYHYVDTNIGYGDGQKQFGWNVLDFSTGWPVALEGEAPEGANNQPNNAGQTDANQQSNDVVQNDATLEVEGCKPKSN